MNQYDILKQYFGYSAFREGQETLIDAILSGRDVLGIMPTGAGKSLCYQVPGLMLPGITLVISPLISLMKDQVEALILAGAPAAYMNSSLTLNQYVRTLGRAKEGRYKIIYVAPERLGTEGFLDFAHQAQISMITVDEAHCVSQWGQDFRPGYLQIAEFVRRISADPVTGEMKDRPVISAFTATATKTVGDDIVKLLELKDPLRLLTGFDRKNLYFEVKKPADKKEEVLRILSDHVEESGIIYCATRKNVEEVCAFLCGQGYRAARYHAGLSEEERTRSQEDFLYDRRTIMVATNAFGMGIDKSNVSFVIHFNMPKNMESYYQEAGRAGRDGEPASCILMYGGQDVITNQFLIERSVENDGMDPQLREFLKDQDRERLKAMTFYCHTRDCLRSYLLRYFGEQSDSYCGNCGNCLKNFEESDVTEEAEKILSCVEQTGQRYGVKMMVDTLRGSRGERLLRLGMKRYPAYGCLSGKKEAAIREIIQHLSMNGYLEISRGEYPVLHLGGLAAEVLSGERRVVMKKLEEREEPPALSKTKSKSKSAGRQAGEQSAEPVLFEILRELRGDLASREKVPAYLIFTNAALADMCAKLPRTQGEFLQVSGVGQAKMKRYGNEFLEAINAYLDE